MKTWTSDTPADGWWFQRWKSEPHRWFIVEVCGRAILAKGLLPGDVWTAQDRGAEWCGPIEPGLCEPPSQLPAEYQPQAAAIIAAGALDKCTDEARLEIFRAYCSYCGCKQPEGRQCQCWNDE